jgi:hypothetical protein
VVPVVFLAVAVAVALALRVGDVRAAGSHDSGEDGTLVHEPLAPPYSNSQIVILSLFHINPAVFCNTSSNTSTHLAIRQNER